MFVAYDVSLQLIREIRVVMPAVRRADKNLADQLGRAATSVALNLGEGARRTAGDQRRLFEIAHGSAAEVRAAIGVGVAWGWIGEPGDLLAVLDRMMALMWRLTQPRDSARAALERARLTQPRDSPCAALEGARLTPPRD